jgi:hypothetical protein
MKVVACIGWLSTDVFLSRTATAGAFAIYTTNGGVIGCGVIGESVSTPRTSVAAAEFFGAASVAAISVDKYITAAVAAATALAQAPAAALSLMCAISSARIVSLSRTAATTRDSVASSCISNRMRSSNLVAALDLASSAMMMMDLLATSSYFCWCLQLTRVKLLRGNTATLTVQHIL